MRFSELKQKEVINCRNCERLGFVCDVGIDICNASVISLIIPGPCKIWGILGRDQEYIIPWKCVRQIGDDIILVDVDADKLLMQCEEWTV